MSEQDVQSLEYEVGAILCGVAQAAHDRAHEMGPGPMYLPLDHHDAVERIIALVREHARRGFRNRISTMKVAGSTGPLTAFGNSDTPPTEQQSVTQKGTETLA